MRPLYAARLPDIGPADMIVAEWARCFHGALPTALFLRRRGLPATTLVLDLKPRLRCWRCGSRRAVLSIQWGKD